MEAAMIFYTTWAFPPLAEMIGLLGLAVGVVYSGFSQELNDPPLRFVRTRLIAVANRLNIFRRREPVSIPLSLIREQMPDFNPQFFRLKHLNNRFEPLDIPAQIHAVPGMKNSAELVFQLDLDPSQEVVIELQYNPDGVDQLPDYPVRARSFSRWYRDGSNCAWENEIIAYRYYFGMVDYFGKSFPLLCLDRLKPDSYHHERLWGQDPYAVGKTPGLGGVVLIEGDRVTPCYGYPDDFPEYRFEYQSHGDGAVCAGVTLRFSEGGTEGESLTVSTVLFADRYENRCQASVPRERLKNGVHIAPGLRKFDGEKVTLDENAGFIFSWGRPVEEYGTVGTACVWRPADFAGIHETPDGRFVRLKPDRDGRVSYLTLGVWSRASSRQPGGEAPFLELAQQLALGLGSPPEVAFR
jgi:hypothetical protein